MLWTLLQSFSSIPLMASEEKLFFSSRKFSLLAAMATIQIQRFGQKLICLQIGRGLLKEYFCKTFCQNTCSEIAINVMFHFHHYKSMATVSYRSNQSSPIAIKNVIIRSNAVMWNLVKIGVMAAEEMSFENVDRRTTTTNNGCLAIP